ncbi:MAG TPA: hypothetical protein DIT48_11495, partial [Actinobacteria bacterium]|nr:hypothetical protein [Actinomycetota bacterium]
VFATLIGVERDGRLEVGVASAPALGRRWWAARGEGALAGPTGPGRDEPAEPRLSTCPRSLGLATPNCASAA